MSAVSRAAAAIAECRLLASMTEEPGRITRRFLTPPVAEVQAHLRARMESLGMAVTIDALGNLRSLWSPGPATSQRITRRLILGSHIDTVPNAGAFDGVLGVVLALELVAAARAISLPMALEVIAFSEEEGVRFGVPFLGSRAVAGRFDPDLLRLVDSGGVTLEAAIRSFGLAPAGIGPAEIEAALLSDEAIGYFELHIEQGPVLEAEGLSVGVVTGIIGQTRAELLFTGQANHAGATPMHLRHDALAAAAEFTVAVERLANESGERFPLVATVGKLSIDPNAGNVIAGSVRASLEVRCLRDTVREEAVTRLLELAGTAAKKRSVTLEARIHMAQPAVPMDEEFTALLAESIEANDLPVRHLPSGAGHDAMVMATRVPSAMLFLRSPGGISHHPAESVLEQDVEAALQVGELFIRRLAHKRDL